MPTHRTLEDLDRGDKFIIHPASPHAERAPFSEPDGTANRFMRTTPHQFRVDPGNRRGLTTSDVPNAISLTSGKDLRLPESLPVIKIK